MYVVGILFNTHSQRIDNIAESCLLHGRSRLILFVGVLVDDLLVGEERLVVDALDHEDAEKGQEKRLKEVEKLDEDHRGHAMVLVIQVDSREKVVEIIYVTPFS